jgi:hypothetical protein
MSDKFKEGQLVRILPNVFGGAEGREFVGKTAEVLEVWDAGEVVVYCAGNVLYVTDQEIEAKNE